MLLVGSKRDRVATRRGGRQQGGGGGQAKQPCSREQMKRFPSCRHQASSGVECPHREERDRRLGRRMMLRLKSYDLEGGG